MQKFLNTKQTAVWLRVSNRTLYRYVHNGMPCVRLTARAIRFNVKDVEKWIQENR